MTRAVSGTWDIVMSPPPWFRLIVTVAALIAGLNGCDRGRRSPDAPPVAAAAPRLIDPHHAITRYGRLEAISYSEGSNRLELDGRTILTVEAADPAGNFAIDFFLIEQVFSRGDRDVFLIAAGPGGQICPTHYLVLELGPAGSVRTSPPFGTCSSYNTMRISEEGFVIEVPEHHNVCWVYHHDGSLEQRRCYSRPRVSGNSSAIVAAEGGDETACYGPDRPTRCLNR